jgi:HSP20 family protein
MALPVPRRSRSALAERGDPINEFEDLQERMSQIMESLFDGPGYGNGGSIWSPPVDVEETDEAWIVEADLPGAQQDDVNVEVRGSELIVTGEIKERERRGILRRRTRRTGRFEYRVTLPGEADADNVDARLEGGVLTIRVPKSETGKPRRVEVRSS